MPKPRKTAKISNPVTWPKSVLRLLDAVACIFMATYMTARQRAAASASALV
ncbi:MAG: hypothetical protein NTW87_34850 [Planctomycetota bacterium]|nr:hypothetical protein [Planctomycetota bacterium]